MILLFCFLKQFPFLFNCSSLLFVLLQSFVAPSHFIVNRLPNRIAMCHRWLHCVFSPQDGRRCQLLATLAIVGRLLAPLLATSAPNETNTSITSIRPYFAYAQAHFVQIRRRKQFFVDHNSPSSFSNKSMNHLICHISQSHSLNQTPIFAFENICETVLIKQTNVCNDQRRLFVKHQWNVEHSVKALFSTNIDSILFSSHSNLFEIECLSRAIRRRRQKQQEAAPSQRQCHEQNRIVSTNLSISLSLSPIFVWTFCFDKQFNQVDNNVCHSNGARLAREQGTRWRFRKHSTKQISHCYRKHWHLLPRRSSVEHCVPCKRNAAALVQTNPLLRRRTHVQSNRTKCFHKQIHMRCVAMCSAVVFCRSKNQGEPKASNSVKHATQCPFNPFDDSNSMQTLQSQAKNVWFVRSDGFFQKLHKFARNRNLKSILKCDVDIRLNQKRPIWLWLLRLFLMSALRLFFNSLPTLHWIETIYCNAINGNCSNQWFKVAVRESRWKRLFHKSATTAFFWCKINAFICNETILKKLYALYIGQRRTTSFFSSHDDAALATTHRCNAELLLSRVISLVSRFVLLK